MKKIFKRTSLLLATALIGVTATVQAQKSPQDMDRFVDALMRRMTVEEKIGQLNLPVTGEITTGQAKSSDVAKKIAPGPAGGGGHPPLRRRALPTFVAPARTQRSGSRGEKEPQRKE